MSYANLMKPKSPISPTGWWLTTLLEKKENWDSRSCAVYWENHRLIRASDWREAFRKAVAFGERDAALGNEAFKGRTTFLGVTDLVPIYDPFEDGSEILWNEYNVEDVEGELSVYTEEELAAIYGAEENGNLE
jgi:Domain of unknown function (DUF4288)